MTTTTKKEQLIKHYHTVCAASGMKSDEKRAVLSSYGVESSKDLTEQQLLALIVKLSQEPNAWRKRVMAAIGAWLRVIKKTDGSDVVKAIACRAAGYDNFNKIPVSRLRDLYYEFYNKSKTAGNIQNVQAEIINNIMISN
jgi:hypothetical protein